MIFQVINPKSYFIWLNLQFIKTLLFFNKGAEVINIIQKQKEFTPKLFPLLKQRISEETITIENLDIKVIIIRMRYVPIIDATGFQSLKEIVKTFKERGILVILSGIGLDLRKSFENNGMFEIIERKYIVLEITKAVSKAKKYLEVQS